MGVGDGSHRCLFVEVDTVDLNLWIIFSEQKTLLAYVTADIDISLYRVVMTVHLLSQKLIDRTHSIEF